MGEFLLDYGFDYGLNIAGAQWTSPKDNTAFDWYGYQQTTYIYYDATTSTTVDAYQARSIGKALSSGDGDSALLSLNGTWTPDSGGTLTYKICIDLNGTDEIYSDTLTDADGGAISVSDEDVLSYFDATGSFNFWIEATVANGTFVVTDVSLDITQVITEPTITETLAMEDSIASIVVTAPGYDHYLGSKQGTVYEFDAGLYDDAGNNITVDWISKTFTADNLTGQPNLAGEWITLYSVGLWYFDYGSTQLDVAVSDSDGYDWASLGIGKTTVGSGDNRLSFYKMYCVYSAPSITLRISHSSTTTSFKLVRLELDYDIAGQLLSDSISGVT